MENEVLLVQENEVSMQEDNDNYNEETSNGVGFGALFLLGLGAAAAALTGVAAYKYKHSEKKTQKDIAKLEKKGFVVYKPKDTEANEEYYETSAEEHEEE